MSELTPKRATRQGVKPLVGLFGPSGGGKTFSALMLARGLVGPAGKIVGIDTENGRMSLFADCIPGGFDVIDLGEPFGPDRYEAAIVEAEKTADCIVVDSLTHGWDGPGGILDAHEQELDRMAGPDLRKREACKITAWIKPKRAQKQFVQRLLRLKCALICCLRAQEKTHIERNQGGKTEVFTDKFTSPIYDPRFIFELLVNGEVYARDGVGGYVHWTKVTHPAVRALLPKDDEQVSVKFGERLAGWCANPSSSPTAATPPRATEDADLKAIKKQFAAMLPVDARVDARAAYQWAIDESIIDQDWRLETMTKAQFVTAIERLDRRASR